MAESADRHDESPSSPDELVSRFLASRTEVTAPEKTIRIIAPLAPEGPRLVVERNTEGKILLALWPADSLATNIPCFVDVHGMRFGYGKDTSFGVYQCQPDGTPLGNGDPRLLKVLRHVVEQSGS